MTIGNTLETSMNYLFSSLCGKDKRKRLDIFLNDFLVFFKDEDEKHFQQWKDSMAMESRMSGGLSTENRQKV